MTNIERGEQGPKEELTEEPANLRPKEPAGLPPELGGLLRLDLPAEQASSAVPETPSPSKDKQGRKIQWPPKEFKHGGEFYGSFEDFD